MEDSFFFLEPKRILMALVPSSSSGCDIAVNLGLVSDSTTGPSKVMIEISSPICLFNSAQAWMAPTLEYSVEHIIQFNSGLFLRRSIVISLENDGSSKLVVR